VETFSTEEEAITRANETVYGLAASVWTTNSARSLSAPRRLDFGTVWVNSHLVIANEMPWGGFKGSGDGGISRRRPLALSPDCYCHTGR
jgi:aldehyde dehydrogenase (NAD+)/aminobutyraldehyde dehydrogenase